MLRSSLLRASMRTMTARAPIAQQRANSFVQRQAVRSFAAKSTATETPILYYLATQQAKSSMNHRMTYVNWIAILWVCDMIHGFTDF